jgi:hypothetical protein
MGIEKDENADVGISDAPRPAGRSEALTNFALNPHLAYEFHSFPDCSGNGRGLRSTIGRLLI